MRFGRVLTIPLTWSWKTRSHPLSSSASTCNVKLCSPVEDLAKMAWEKSIPGMERLILEMVAAGGLVQGESIEPIDPVHSRRRGRDQGTQAQTGLIFVKARLEGFEE